MLGTRRPVAADGPPFQGGVIGLVAYEFGGRLEPSGLPRDPDWPDLILARYDALLAFDHQTHTVFALGRGQSATRAAGNSGEGDSACRAR